MGKIVIGGDVLGLGRAAKSLANLFASIGQYQPCRAKTKKINGRKVIIHLKDDGSITHTYLDTLGPPGSPPTESGPKEL